MSLRSNSATVGESTANALHGIFYGLLIFGNLYLWVRVTGRGFDQTYLIMGVLAFFVSLPVFKRYNVTDAAPANGVRPVGSQMTISWLIVVVALIMIIYLLKMSG